ncbi:hypothetical protein J6590_104445 [Homalodisca vitripennis]|nr:hypothetical protein J6590_104445 [Homalodisca vitripennis]
MYYRKNIRVAMPKGLEEPKTYPQSCKKDSQDWHKSKKLPIMATTNQDMAPVGSTTDLNKDHHQDLLLYMHTDDALLMQLRLLTQILPGPFTSQYVQRLQRMVLLLYILLRA